LRLSPFKAAPGTWCTCPPKYNLNVYKGRCAHACIYCYSIKFPSFRSGPPEPRKALAERILVMARNTRPIRPVMVSDCTDPYQPIEAELCLTRRCLSVLMGQGFPILVVTKSDLVARDVDLLSSGRAVVSMTVTTLDKAIARRIEPGAPSPDRRLRALEELAEAGVPVTVRADPIIPGVNDEPRGLRELIEAVADVGASQITSSTFKPVRGTFELIKEVDEELYASLRRAYSGGEWRGGYLYLPAKQRLTLMKAVREMAISRGLDFAVCREGFVELNTTICDGTAILRKGQKRLDRF